MNRETLLARFANINTWQSGGQRAPHKPLLILLALGEWQNGRPTICFADAQKSLTDLLREYGPPRKAHHPEFPFWRLQKDGVWEVVVSSSPKLGAEGGPSKGELLRVDATGQFTADIRTAFIGDPSLVSTLGQFILQNHFPESLHQDILDAVGLELADPGAGGGRRDPGFRRAVLTAYEFQCAVCGLQLLLSGFPIALEAAHIQWHQAKGPSTVQNGLCLCCLHHKVFDLGALTISNELNVIVSDQAAGLSGFHDHLMSHHKRKIKVPIHKSDAPNPDFIAWHHHEVFRGNSRPD
jgi:putative restriction endonuclease